MPVGADAAKDKIKKINPHFRHKNKPCRISPNEVSQLWLIYTVYHLLMKNNKVEEREGS